MLLPITLTMAGAATLLNVWLGSRCVRARFAGRIEHGDGGQPLMLKRMRAHANFTEYTPFFLILLGLIEYAQGPRTWLWAISILYILGRVMHPFGMDRPSPNPLRGGGAMITFGVLIVLAAYALYLPYSAMPAA
jgi:uncharacterized protein